jgi:hypothetical protein
MKTEKVLDLVKQFDELEEKERDFLGYMINIILDYDMERLVDTYIAVRKMHNEYDLGERQIYAICSDIYGHSMLKEPLFSLREEESDLVDSIRTFCNTDSDWDEELPLLDRLSLYKEWQSLFNELFNDGQLENFYNLYFRWNTVQSLLAMDGVHFSIYNIISAFVDLTEDKEEERV